MLLVMRMKKTRTRRRHSLADVYDWKDWSIVVRFHPPRQRGFRWAAGVWDYSFGIGSTSSHGFLWCEFRVDLPLLGGKSVCGSCMGASVMSSRSIGQPIKNNASDVLPNMGAAV
jgi:hypothetical protein